MTFANILTQSESDGTISALLEKAGELYLENNPLLLIQEAAGINQERRQDHILLYNIVEAGENQRFVLSEYSGQPRIHELWFSAYEMNYNYRFCVNHPEEESSLVFYADTRNLLAGLADLATGEYKFDRLTIVYSVSGTKEDVKALRQIRQFQKATGISVRLFPRLERAQFQDMRYSQSPASMWALKFIPLARLILGVGVDIVASEKFLGRKVAHLSLLMGCNAIALFFRPEQLFSLLDHFRDACEEIKLFGQEVACAV